MRELISVNGSKLPEFDQLTLVKGLENDLKILLGTVSLKRGLLFVLSFY